jgi:adenylate kinase
MIIALTGTPGTGKSTVSRLLREEGFTVLALNELAATEKLFLDYDSERQTHEVDLEGLDKYLEKYLKTLAKGSNKAKNPPLILEGHIAHLLAAVEIIVILRCHPEVLKKRLSEKHWPESKILENLEAEALDTITIESVGNHQQDKIFEINTTNKPPNEVRKIISQIINGKIDRREYTPGKLDWSEEILKWY